MKSIEEHFKEFESKKNKWLDIIFESRQMILANLSMISQVPATTFFEKDRAELLVNRFTECGVSEVRTDDRHNVIASINRKNAEQTIMVSTHMDNQFDHLVDQNITITEDRAYGSGVADDNIALAVLLTIQDILSKLNISFDSNIILLATTRFHGRGDFGGMRHFIKNENQDIKAAINMNGIMIGTINYFTMGRVRCDIKCEMTGDSSAILVANEIMDSLFAIPLPKKPKTTLNVGMISGGERYSTLSREALINLEVLCEDDSLMDKLIDEIQNICTDIGARHGAVALPEFFGRHHTSSLTSAHHIIKSAVSVIKSMGFNPKTEYSNSEIAVTLEENIPSVSLGLTTGDGGSSPKSFIDISPLSMGVLQIIMLLQLLDAGANGNG